MRTKVKIKSYGEVMALKRPRHRKPIKPILPIRVLLKLVSSVMLIFDGFKCQRIGMEKLGKDEPCLILMNHSSFVDLEIAEAVMGPRPLNIICTTDGLLGKEWLMRLIGCIPTRKFVTDSVLVKDMVYALKTLKSSVLMYPEAGYSFDGTATVLPDVLGKCVKLLGVPVVMITTYGAYSKDPLYNNLQKRRVKVTAKVEYVLSPEEVGQKTAAEINEVIQQCFSFDNFKWQQENKVRIREKFRADFLNRLLYKCPSCLSEEHMHGDGIMISCGHCGKQYELTEFGHIKAVKGETEFSHIPDWYRWERECVRKEILEGVYHMELPVDICMLVNSKCIYRVGEGMLKHTMDGFHLTGCEGALDYIQKAKTSYTLNSDFYWYQLGDVIGIGDHNALYYCFPKTNKDVVAKARLATEEIYKMLHQEKSAKRSPVAEG
ncbi:MAG: 1-acyl-sn-glycerol-3-phosphate acyltransferase [Lachnospiraceae bacterium]|nr:1-acyl-sn-glycerol-3-phosphate acyltransferase [Lachnospiraceae bacterium]